MVNDIDTLYAIKWNKKLGKSNSSVYPARKNEDPHSQDIAMKESDYFPNDENSKIEFNLLSRIKHPNIIKVFECYIVCTQENEEENHKIYIFMEKAKGK